MCPSTKITNAVQKYDKQFNFAREKYLDVQLLFNDYQRFKLILFLLVLLCFQLKNSMWNDLPLPEGPRQKKLELSVSLCFPSFPVMSMATGTPCLSV